MITETVTTPPQTEHLFVLGLRFEGELQYLSKASGNHKATFREVKMPKVRRDGGLAWCSAVAASILGVWPLTEHAIHHSGWVTTDSALIEQLVRNGGLALIQLGDGYSNWWAVVTGVELDRACGNVTALLLLDVTQSLPWSAGYNARMAGIANSDRGALNWQSIDGAHLKVNILRWLEICAPQTA